MSQNSIPLSFILNGKKVETTCEPGQNLLSLLRSLGMYSVKNGCSEGDCGMCTVLINNQPITSCMTKAQDVQGKEIITLEGLSSRHEIHPIQQAFIETGAIQCGYCTPAQILTAKALLDKNPKPSREEIGEALSGVLCRCTGYVKIIDAVERAAQWLRGEPVPEEIELPPTYTPPEMSKYEELQVVGKPVQKVDAVKLAKGYPVFTDDYTMPGMLYGALLTSPHAHARIKNIDTSKAKALPGVHAVLTYKDIPRVKYASGGQSYPQPEPYDQVSLDNKVRYVGDRVAVVAAETPQIAERALRLIEVEYEVLPHVLDPIEAMKDGAPVIHDEDDSPGIYDAKHNIVYHIEAEVGNVDETFAQCDHIFEGEYTTPKQQHAHLEPHVCITYWDEDDRLHVRTSTQVPYHARRIIAPLIGLPVKKIRVVKPRIGGGFGNKQEVVLEDLCAHLTIATGRPVRMEYTRRQEFTSSRTRHNQIIRYKVGLKGDEVVAMELYVIGDTGAYATHGLTVQMVGGFKGLTLYNPPHARFISDVVYTNKPISGAFRGYGTMQETFALEVLMEEIAEKLKLDVVKFKQKNILKVGETMYLATELGEGRKGHPQTLSTSGIDQCLEIGLKETDYYNKRKQYKEENMRSNLPLKRGIGMALVMHGSGVAGLDMASVTIKINDDGSFNLLTGSTDIGTGSDTILAQIAAETLGVPTEDIIVYAADTDFTPFDTGAYASCTTYITGGAVYKAAAEVRRQILEHAATMLGVDNPSSLILRDRKVFSPKGKSVTLAEIALDSLHWHSQHQIIASASFTSLVSPPPTAAQFVEVVVDTETGEIKAENLLMIVDCGRVINPITASGQVEGGMLQALGFAQCEDLYFDENGRILNAKLGPYHIFKSNEIPEMKVMFVQTDEPTGPYGAKSISEIAIDGVAPALVNAIHHATGVWIRNLPLTPERVWRALRAASKL